MARIVYVGGWSASSGVSPGRMIMISSQHHLVRVILPGGCPAIATASRTTLIRWRPRTLARGWRVAASVLSAVARVFAFAGRASSIMLVAMRRSGPEQAVVLWRHCKEDPVCRHTTRHKVEGERGTLNPTFGCRSPRRRSARSGPCRAMFGGR